MSGESTNDTDVMKVLYIVADNEHLLKEYEGQSFEAIATALSERIKPNTELESFNSDLPYDALGLNPIERQLFEQNHVEGVKVLSSAKVAIEIAESEWVGNTLHNGNGDAFRHALWNWLMKASMNPARAKVWGDAHEAGTPANPPLEKQMDLFNNEKGRNLQTSTNGRSQINQMTKLGELRRIVNNSLVPTNADGKL